MRERGVNVHLVGEEIHQDQSANIAVAIATDDGLYPATVHGAEALSPQDIAARVSEMAERAASGALTREDISGGSFPLSNLGMFGVSRFAAIINPPMGAILAFGRAREQAVAADGAPSVATVVNATLSRARRVIDGAVGARFLQVLGEEIAALG